MIRRALGLRGTVPAILAAFTVTDWPASTERQAYEAWIAARADWAKHNHWPGGDAALHGSAIAVAASLPDEPWSPPLHTPGPSPRTNCSPP